MDVQGFRDADETRNSAGDCIVKSCQEVSQGVSEIFFSSFRTTGPAKPDLGFPPEILSGARSENAGHLPPASQVLLRVPFGQEKYKPLSKSEADV